MEEQETESTRLWFGPTFNPRRNITNSNNRIRNTTEQDESVSDEIYRKLYADNIVYDDPTDQRMHLLLVNIYAADGAELFLIIAIVY
jgi:hypothetical protein